MQRTKSFTRRQAEKRIQIFYVFMSTDDDHLLWGLAHRRFMAMVRLQPEKIGIYSRRNDPPHTQVIRAITFAGMERKRAQTKRPAPLHKPRGRLQIRPFRCELGSCPVEAQSPLHRCCCLGHCTCPPIPTTLEVSFFPPTLG